MKRIWSYLTILLALSWGLLGCSDRLTPPELSTVEQSLESFTTGKLSEVAPPNLIQQLQPALEQYQPQVSIVSPKFNQVLQDTTVQIQLQVKDLPIFKNPDLEMGPHLHLIVDNEPYQAIYDINKPVIVENLAPGTHTIRVFASRPWHESFKNEGAYAQTTFHIFSKTDNNQPVPYLPLLTYSRPNGNYGAEPIMLDFYLTNAPLHLIAQENPEDEIVDWRIRVTINGESFFLDKWQPIYLKGFQEGRNWVQLEFLDEGGNPISNAYNNSIRLISYIPNGQDTLSQLVRDELSLEQARGIIDPNYKAQSLPVSEPNPEPAPTEEELGISEEETLPSSPSPSIEKTPSFEKENLPQNLSPTSENSETTEESQQLNENPSIEESVNIEEQVSSEKITQNDFSSQEEPVMSSEKTSEDNLDDLEEILPDHKEKTSIIVSPVAEDKDSQTLTETKSEQIKILNSDDYREQKTPSSDQSTKYKWLEKIRNRLKQD